MNMYFLFDNETNVTEEEKKNLKEINKLFNTRNMYTKWFSEKYCIFGIEDYRLSKLLMRLNLKNMIYMIINNYSTSSVLKLYNVEYDNYELRFGIENIFYSLKYIGNNTNFNGIIQTNGTPFLNFYKLIDYSNTSDSKKVLDNLKKISYDDMVSIKTEILNMMENNTYHYFNITDNLVSIKDCSNDFSELIIMILKEIEVCLIKLDKEKKI